MSYLIEVKNLSKKFSKNYASASKNGLKTVFKRIIGLDDKPSKDLKSNEFWAVNDVSFKLSKGDCLALIGLNGSGKSTTLKMLNNLYLPDFGEIKINGNIDALIELGAGFHPHLSGRENIKLKCAMNRWSIKESQKYIEQIIEFSELEDFIDSPVNTYSSGMHSRLGFSSAIFSNPDILFVDEVLSVGDFAFRQKCLDKMNEIKKDAAIIFVSHSLDTVKRFCNRAILLEKGSAILDSDVDNVTKLYLDKNLNVTSSNLENSKLREDVFGSFYHNNNKVCSLTTQWENSKGVATKNFKPEEDLYLRISAKFKFKPQNLIIGLPTWDKQLRPIFNINSDVDGINLTPSISGDLNLVLKIKNSFNATTLQSVLVIVDGPEFLIRTPIDQINISSNNARSKGMFKTKNTWDVLIK